MKRIRSPVSNGARANRLARRAPRRVTAGLNRRHGGRP